MGSRNLYVALATGALTLSAACSPGSADSQHTSASADAYRQGAEARARHDAWQAGWEETDRTAAAAAAAEEACADLARPAGEAAFDAVWAERQPELDALDRAADEAFEAAGWAYDAPAYQAALTLSEAVFAQVADEAAAAREGATEGAYFECIGGAL